MTPLDETKWLVAYARAMKLAQEFENGMLGLLLSARHYAKDKDASADFLRLLGGDFKSPAGQALFKLFEKRPLADAVTAEVFRSTGERNSLREVLQNAVDARNLLAHIYFRTHHFSGELAELLIQELEGLGYVIITGTQMAGWMQQRISPGKTHFSDHETLRRQIDYFFNEHSRMHELSKRGHAWKRLVVTE